MNYTAAKTGPKFRVGVIGGTGYVGQRFITILDKHPWFETTAVAASARSAGKPYSEAVSGRWKLDDAIPEASGALLVDSIDDLDRFCDKVDFVFCAVDMNKDDIRALEEQVARLETPVVSNNSAHRWTPDVPMVIPEINPGHTALIESQRRRLGTRQGFIIVKPNCSIQSYVPAITPLLDFGPEKIIVCTYQAISGASKTFSDWPEMVENLIPYIGGEEEKSEKEPLKIWGSLAADHIEPAVLPVISAQCYRIAVQEGHTAAVSVKFSHKPSADEILSRWAGFAGEPQLAQLPSAPIPFLQYLTENSRPQPKLDSMAGNGMAVTIGRLREDAVFDYKFTCLSHNTLRGAAGGAVLTAELLVRQGYLTCK
jgi:aspartate-semialdehyde dehydrogenase